MRLILTTSICHRNWSRAPFIPRNGGETTDRDGIGGKSIKKLNPYYRQMRVHEFQVLKDLVNVWPKLDYRSDIILCTDASYTNRRKNRLMLLSNRYGSLAKHLRLSKVDGQPSKRRPMQYIMLYKSWRICSEVYNSHSEQTIIIKQLLKINK